MKRLLVIVGIFSLFFTGNAFADGENKLDSTDGFKGFKWGTNISKNKFFKFKDKNKKQGYSHYNLKGDNKTILKGIIADIVTYQTDLNGNLEKVHYVYNDSLCGDIYDAIIDSFGEPDSDKSEDMTFMLVTNTEWIGKLTTINLSEMNSRNVTITKARTGKKIPVNIGNSCTLTFQQSNDKEQ